MRIAIEQSASAGGYPHHVCKFSNCCFVTNSTSEQSLVQDSQQVFFHSCSTMLVKNPKKQRPILANVANIFHVEEVDMKAPLCKQTKRHTAVQ